MLRNSKRDLSANKRWQAGKTRIMCRVDIFGLLLYAKCCTRSRFPSRDKTFGKIRREITHIIKSSRKQRNSRNADDTVDRFLWMHCGNYSYFLHNIENIFHIGYISLWYMPNLIQHYVFMSNISNSMFIVPWMFLIIWNLIP